MMVTASTSSRFDCSVGEIWKIPQLLLMSQSTTDMYVLDNIQQGMASFSLCSVPSCMHIVISPVMHTEASTVHLPQCVGHASFVSQESGEVNWLARVIFGPCSNPAPVFLAAFPG